MMHLNKRGDIVMSENCEKNCKFCCTKVENLNVSFGKDKIINNVSFHIHCNEITVLIGKNGSGKSTLLRAILNEIPSNGKITFSSHHNKSKKLTIGYVPQNLNMEESSMSVYDFMRVFLKSTPGFLKKDKASYDEIKEHLKEFDVEHVIDEKMSSLSGGQLQRVLIAVATMPYPELLILDEPLSGIDMAGREKFYKLICKIKDKHDVAILLVSHDFIDVKKYADKVILLNRKILIEGTPDIVFKSDKFKKELGTGV